MIDILGLKRIVVIVVLVAINVVLASATYMYLVPQKYNREFLLNSVSTENQQKQAEIRNMQVGLDEIERQKGAYESLVKKRFFYNQNRREAERILLEIQDRSGVLSALVGISPGDVEENEAADKAGYKVFSSPIKISIEAMSDVAIYRYIELLKKYFPGDVFIDHMAFKRANEMDSELLKTISKGDDVVLVEGDIDMTWRTMVKDSEVKKIMVNSGDGQANQNALQGGYSQDYGVVDDGY